MPKVVNFAGKSYLLPETGEEAIEYWQGITDFLEDVPGSVFQKDSGLFELTQTIDFGSLHGVRAKSWSSRSGNEANTGVIRLSKDDFIAFRNEANNADVTLGKDNEDFLTFNSQRLLVDPTTTQGDLITRNAAGVLVRQDRAQLKTEFDAEPLGKIISVDSRYTSVPATGQISAEGYALCNGQALPAGHQLTTSETHLPDLTDNRYLKGSTTSGTRSGSNTTTLTVNNLPSHTHSDGSYTTSISLSGSPASLSVSKPFLTGTTTFAAAGHTHNAASMFACINAAGGANQSRGMIYRPVGNVSWAATWRSGASGASPFTPEQGINSGVNFGVQVLGATTGNNANASVGLNQGSWSLSGGSYSLSGSPNVSGTSGSTGSGTAFTTDPAHHTVVFLMKVRKV